MNSGEIVSDTPDNRAYATKKNENNETRFIKAEAESDMILVKDEIILISYDTQDPGAIVINDQGMRDSLQSQFEILWKQAE